MSTQFTDSQVLSATVASTASTSLGVLAVPSGRSFRIGRMWCGAGGGTFTAKLNTLPSMQGVRVQNSTDPTQIGQTDPYTEDILAIGPCELEVTVENVSSASVLAKCVIQYLDSGAN